MQEYVHKLKKQTKIIRIEAELRLLITPIITTSCET